MSEFPLAACATLTALLLLVPLDVSASSLGCPAVYEPACGFKKTCGWGACTHYRTYSNACTLAAAGAEFMHTGACEGSEISRKAPPPSIFADEYPFFSFSREPRSIFTGVQRPARSAGRAHQTESAVADPIPVKSAWSGPPNALPFGQGSGGPALFTLFSAITTRLLPTIYR